MKIAKYKMSITPSETEEFIHKHVFRSIRTKSLQKLVLIWHNLNYSRNCPLRQEIVKRLREKELPSCLENIVWELKPKDVMQVIPCSKRTALDYIYALRYLRS